MAKLTVDSIKKQIAALEAKAARLTHEQTKASVGKVRALMGELGVTLEHLSEGISRRASAVKKAVVGKKAAPAKRAGAGAARYRDPKTGATWSGFGRAPAWLASAKDRTAFLIGAKPASDSKTTAPSKRAAGAKKAAAAKKGAAAKKVSSAATKTKAVAKKAATTVKRAAKKASAAAKAPAVKKTAPRKAAAKKVSAAPKADAPVSEAPKAD